MNHFSNPLPNGLRTVRPAQVSEGPVDVENFDFTAFLNTPLEDLPAPASPVLPYDYEPHLMDLDRTPVIEYPQEENNQASGNMVTSHSDMGSVATTIASEAGKGYDRTYRNNILYSFDHPTVPLRVIDQVKYPFEHDLQLALEMELERQHEQALLDIVDEVVEQDQSWQSQDAILGPLVEPLLPVPPTPTPTPTPVPVRLEPMPQDPIRKAGNRRRENIKKLDPSAFYLPLLSIPSPWGTITPTSGEHLFQYTQFGELNPLSLFTTAQISEYIGNHPLNLMSARPDSIHSGLILWIQSVPADSGKRYPNRVSDKCRFTDCPVPQHTIRKGEFRVAFDEQHLQNGKKDPFHNAGYVHLYCLEKFLDFPQICKNFNVRPDTRKLPEGKNRMAITRDHQSMEKIVMDFIRDSAPWQQFGNGQRPRDYYPYTLCYQLTMEHLNQQPKHIQVVREKRGGNSIDVHKGNLDLCVSNNRKLKEMRANEPKMSLHALEKRKKRLAEADDFDLDENILYKEFSGSSRPLKRSRRSSRKDSWP